MCQCSLRGLAVECELNGLHRKQREVVDQTRYGLFAAANTGEEDVVARFRKGTLANLFFRFKECAAPGLVCVLRAISQQLLQPFELVDGVVGVRDCVHIGHIPRGAGHSHELVIE